MDNKQMIDIPTQVKLKNTLVEIPVEYFQWGTYPDHFKIDMPHRHEFSEILFFQTGGGTHEIAYKDNEIKSFSIHYVPKSTVHFLKQQGHFKGFTIAFDAEYFENNNVHKFLNPLNLLSFVVNLRKEMFEEILNLTIILLQSIKKDSSYYRSKCFLLTMELLLNVIALERSHDAQLERVMEDDNFLLRQFKYLVNTQIQNQRKVQWYARELNLSPKYLGGYIKRHLGIPAKQYIQEELLTHVKRELINTKKSIKQIAYEYYLEESAICKFFKKHVGFTMKKYRSYQNEEN